MGNKYVLQNSFSFHQLQSVTFIHFTILSYIFGVYVKSTQLELKNIIDVSSNENNIKILIVTYLYSM